MEMNYRQDTLGQMRQLMIMNGVKHDIVNHLQFEVKESTVPWCTWNVSLAEDIRPEVEERIKQYAIERKPIASVFGSEPMVKVMEYGDLIMDQNPFGSVLNLDGIDVVSGSLPDSRIGGYRHLEGLEVDYDEWKRGHEVTLRASKTHPLLYGEVSVKLKKYTDLNWCLGSHVDADYEDSVSLVTSIEMDHGDSVIVDDGDFTVPVLKLTKGLDFRDQVGKEDEHLLNLCLAQVACYNGYLKQVDPEPIERLRLLLDQDIKIADEGLMLNLSVNGVHLGGECPLGDAVVMFHPSESDHVDTGNRLTVFCYAIALHELVTKDMVLSGRWRGLAMESYSENIAQLNYTEDDFSGVIEHLEGLGIRSVDSGIGSLLTYGLEEGVLTIQPSYPSRLIKGKVIIHRLDQVKVLPDTLMF